MRRTVRIGLLTLAAALAGLLAAVAPAATPRHHTAARCRVKITTIARGQGAPDDLAYDGTRLLVSDIHADTLGVVRSGHVATLIGGIAGPEGMIVRSPTQLELAAQTPNQILSVDLRTRRTRVVSQLPTVAGQSGVDSIEAAPGGDTYAPDSANGTVYRLHHGRLSPLATGLSRPVDAISWAGGVAVAEEYGARVDLIRAGHQTMLARVVLPDDLVALAGHLLVTSQTGQIWEVAPHRRLLTHALVYPQGMAADGTDAVVVSEQSTNRIVRISGLTGCL